MADNYCKACRKKIQPSLLDMIEEMRDRLWELEEGNPFYKPGMAYNDPDNTGWCQADQQMMDTLIDKWNKLDDYYNLCEEKLGMLYNQIDRMDHNE